MSAILIRGCDAVVTMDDAGTELSGASLLLRDGVIAWSAGTMRRARPKPVTPR